MASAPRHDDRSAVRSDLTGTSEAVRTPGPWAFEQGFILANGEALKVVGVQVPMVGGPARLEAIANAAFIVRACNAHDELVAALRDSYQLVAELEDAINEGLKLLPEDVARIADSCEASRAALSKATGEA